MLIIKYERLKSFLRKAEENGFTWICVLKTQMSQHYMKKQYYHDSNKGNCQAGKMDSSMLFSCLPGPFGGRAQTLLHKLV